MDNHGENRDQGNHRENTCKLIEKQIVSLFISVGDA